MKVMHTHIVHGIAILAWILLYSFHLAAWWLLAIIFIHWLYVMVMGAIYIERNFYIQAINQLPASANKQICLTFDDGIDAQLTPQILDMLDAAQVKACFFLIGKNIAGNEHIVTRMHNAGHLIGNHSMQHGFWFSMQRKQQIADEINLCNHAIEQIIQIKPKYFRPPYGVTNPTIAKAIQQTAMQTIGWNVRSMDTVAKSASDLLHQLKQKTKPGAIVLLHDRCPNTVAILTDYIAFCKNEGYTFVQPFK